jgi:hypothetical protein
MYRLLVPAIAITFGFAPSLTAQSRDARSFDVTLGRSFGAGGKRPYFSSDDVAAEITLGLRPRVSGRATWATALTIGRRSGPLEFGDRCRVQPTGDPGCETRFPTFSHIGLLGGAAWQASRLELRGLVGPAWFTGGGPSGVGAQAHLDAALGFRHVAFIVATRGSWVARVGGESLRCRSLEFGLRVR